MIRNVRHGWIFVCLIFSFHYSFSQFSTVKKSVIEMLKRDISNQYVSKDLANKMCDSLNYYDQSGKYDNCTTIDYFTYRLTKDLRRISNDQHICVNANHRREQILKETNSFKKGKNKKKIDYDKFINHFQNVLTKLQEDKFVFGEIKILPGNVGYLEIKEFSPVSLNKKENEGSIELKNAMAFLKRTQAIIIDLRNNCGGDVNQAAKFCSYFSQTPGRYFITLEKNYFYDTNGIRTIEPFKNKAYTFSNITDEFTRNKKIIILTSKFTFSAAELVAYKIKRFNSTVEIIGEKTIGAGNSYSGLNETINFSAIIPTCKLYDEENSNHNIEGNGIIPDLQINADSALVTALRIVNPDDTNNLNTEVFLKKEKALTPQYLMNDMNDYSGNYNKAIVIVENGKLYLIYDTFSKQLLIQLDYVTFQTSEFPSINFTKNLDAHIVKINLTHKDGYVEQYSKE